MRAELESAGLAPNRRTFELLVRSFVVQRDVPRMLASLKARIQQLTSLALLPCVGVRKGGAGCDMLGLCWRHRLIL